MTVGYLYDAFDLLNVRDLDLVAQARSRCTRLVVGVLSDSDAAALFGRAPVVPLVERIDLVRHLRGIDEVVPHTADAVPAADLVMVAHPDLATPGTLLLPAGRESVSPLLRHSLRSLVDGAGFDSGAVA